MPRCVIIGGGIAATQAAETLRSLRPESEIVLLAEEPRPFYLRPLLADFVAQRLPEADLWRSFPDEAAAQKTKVITGHPVVSINRAARTVTLRDGSEEAYDQLLIATGVTPRLPEIPGMGLRGVTAFHTQADAVRLMEWIEVSQRAVVVGRGLQGVELTRALRLRGLEVTLLVPDESPWFPALFHVKGELIEAALQQHGVTVIPLDAPVEVLGHGGHVHAVKTREGREIPADLVGFAGVQRARLEFLVGTGISLADGVVTNAHLQSTDPNVYAAGDVAQIEGLPLGYGWLRASRQGGIAGRNLAGDTVPVQVGDEAEAQALYGMTLLDRWR